MRVVSIANQKGGTGKTTTAAALAQAAAYKGAKVLAIDLDPQGNLSLTMGANANKKGTYELMGGEATLADVMQPTPGGVYIIPASWNLQTLTTSAGSARRLQAAIEPLQGRFDLIVIDTPPTAGELQYNALQASTGLIIPLQADIYGLQGLYQIVDTTQHIQRTNNALQVLGVVLTRHGGRSILARDMQKLIEDKAAELGLPILANIRQAVAIQEAQATQQNLYQYAPNSKPAADYLALYETLHKGGEM